MQNPTKIAIQPNHSNFLLTLKNDFGAEPSILCPKPNSNIKSGMPAVKRANKKAIKNAPPPFS